MDPGYSSYNDPRLIPPDINELDEESNRDAYDRCIHCAACSRVVLLLSGQAMVGVHRLADVLECAECDEWEG